MNTQRLIGGIICLAAALVIAVLTFVLPEDSMMFTVGDANMPLVPAIALAVAGIWLVVTARTRPKAVVGPDFSDAEISAQTKLNRRLEGIAWGLFLIMLGGFSLVPDETIPKGAWPIAVGAIMLGLNGARYYYKMKMSGFTTFLGLLSVFSGILQLAGLNALDGAIFLLILGAYLIFKPWFDERQLFGKIAT